MQMSRKIIVAFRHRQAREYLNFPLYVTEYVTVTIVTTDIRFKDYIIILHWMQTQFVFELPPEKRSILVSYEPYRNEY